MKKISILVLFACILFANKINAQILTNGNVSSSVLNSNVLIDGSTNYSVEAGAGPNVGKGIIVPSVDLVNFAFDLSFADGSTFPTYFDGMVVYNRATGTTSITGNNPSTTTAVTPGFYYFSNPNGATNGNVTAGRWIAIGGGTSKFVDGTPATSAVYTAGNVGIGASTTPNAAAILDLNSTTSGLLVPRMTSAQRDAISSPANALLIWNTSNNTFEVYKTTCSCWVTITDAGNTPASSLVNTAPTASNLNYTGKSIVGEQFILNYTYSDAQADVEGLTSIQWQVAGTSAFTDVSNIPGATTTSYTPTTTNAGLWIRAVVTPRATTGVLNGVQVFGPSVQVESATTSTANNLTVSGTAAQGSTLTAAYTFAGGSGIENTDALLGSTFTWQSATNNTGLGISGAQLYGKSDFEKTYVPQSDLLGRFIRVGIRAKDNTGLHATNFVFSPWVGPITASTETAPLVNNIVITPAPAVNLQITGSYNFYDINNDPEGTSTFQWYRADDASGLNQVAIAGATNINYTVVQADSSKFLGLGVTPKAQSGLLTGTEVITYNTNSVLPVATFTYTGNDVQQLPFFSVNRVMNAQNAIQVEINVTNVGGISFSSTTANGYRFSANYTANTTGLQSVTLSASGTQTAYNAAGDNLILTGVGTTSENKNITIKNTTIGSAFTAYANLASPVENFSSNNSCANALISAGYTGATCSGNVLVGANTYNLVLINGQCWMQSNLKQIPTAFASYTTTSWLNTAQTDLGYWGFFNTTTTNGASGWGSAEPAPNDGLLYQWSAAMNGQTSERSRGVCPTGWHIPSDCEWMYLEHGQGMSIGNQNMDNARSTTSEGAKLRSAGAGATNTSGFSAQLSGARSGSGSFVNYGIQGIYHTSTEVNSTTAKRRDLGPVNSITRFNGSKQTAISVRCLKD